MTTAISITAQSLLKETGIRPQIILDIEGSDIDLLFGAMPILKVLEWDGESAGETWDSGLTWDGFVESEKSRSFIQLNGTTTTISQQISPDKGSANSISTANISLLDKDGEVSKVVSFDEIGEILGRKAVLSIGFAEGVYPEDAQPVLRGVITDFYTETGSVMLTISSTESLKKQTYLEKYQSEINADITNSQTTITVNSTDGLFESRDALTTYVRIEDEIMQVLSFNESSMTVLRAQLNTVANAHDDKSELESFYRLQGTPLDLARKIMLSNEDNSPFSSLDIPKAINFISSNESIANAIIFKYYSIEEKTGLTVGDKVILDSFNNNGTFTVKGFGTLDTGDSYIIVNETLLEEPSYTDNFSYNSRWNVLSTGLEMLTSEIDINQFDSIASAFSSNFVPYDFYIKDTIDDCSSFINSQIFFPSGLFSIIRRARTSVKFVVPPFSNEIVPKINTDAITNITKIKQRRSTHKYLYNTYVYRFNLDSLEDKYLSGKVVISADSVNRIGAGKKTFKISSDGLRNNADTLGMIDNMASRQTDRYQFAPTYFEGVSVKYKDGYLLEIGDIVPFLGADTKFTNLQTGERDQSEQLYEIINKQINIKTGDIKLTLLQTSFELQARYAVVSLASQVEDGSTATKLVISEMNPTGSFLKESDKWVDFIGLRVRVRNDDYSQDEITTFNGVDKANSNILLVDSLSFTPDSSHIIEIPDYEDSSAESDNAYKIQFGYATSQNEITAVNSQKLIEVSKIDEIVIGSQIYFHSDNYDRDSFGQITTVVNITGNEIELNNDLEVVFQVGDKVEKSKFKDDGFPYLLI